MAIALGVSFGCHASDARAPASVPLASTAPAGLAASLDSCGAIRSMVAGDTISRPTELPSSAWAKGRVRAFRTFSLFVPDSAKVVGVDTTNSGVRLSWSGCKSCSLGVSIEIDSVGDGIDGRVKRLVAAQRTVDSINSDPKTDIHEFDEIDGPPQPFKTTNGRGFFIDGDCGDCASVSLVFSRPGFIAEVSLSTDDDEPHGMRHMCEMAVVGKTFQWRDRN